MVACEVSDGGAVIGLRLSGFADVDNCATLHEQLTGAFVAERAIEIELDGLVRVDAAGLQLLVAFKKFVEETGGSLKLLAEGDVVREAFVIAGAESFLVARAEG